MSLEGLESQVGPNGKAIIKELQAIEKQNPDLVRLKETEQGLAVCFKGQDMDVELVQFWGPAAGDAAETLDGRLQYITKKVYLDNGERNRVSNLLQQAKFKPVPGQHGSYRLDFAEGRTSLKFDKVLLSKIRDSIVEIAKITKAARNRSWK